jgi:hypothetical protein|nr:hypothetical protein [Kofleriaceae bacterium]
MSDWVQLTELCATWPGTAWSWDDRFGMVASTFEAAQEPAARASAMRAFPRGWTAKSIDTAPAELIAIATKTGGLRARQRLLGGDAGLYALWWPWGGGDKVTLRVGLVDRDASALRAVVGCAVGA